MDIRFDDPERYKMNCETMRCEKPRNFLTTEEKVEKLESYKKWLENETKGVAQEIGRLQKAS